MQRVLLALALVATAGVSYAQTMPPSRTMSSGQTTMPSNHTMSTRQALDPNGRPFIGRNDFVRQPGDRPGPSGNPNMATAPAAPTPPALSISQERGPRPTAFTDEYGFRYDSEGNRLNAQGYVISPHTR